MPNWCSNSIKITGTKKQISTIKKILEDIKKSDDPCVFEKLVGAPDEKSTTTQSDFWGTKWDVCVDDCSFTFSDKIIRLYPATAWSPPIAFGIKLSKKFGVNLEMIYSEPGINFAGKSIIEKGKLVEDLEYGYMEGLYYFDDELFWQELNNNLEYMQENKDLDKKEILSEYPFLSKTDKKELTKLIDDMISLTKK